MLPRMLLKEGLKGTSKTGRWYTSEAGGSNQGHDPPRAVGCVPVRRDKHTSEGGGFRFSRGGQTGSRSNLTPPSQAAPQPHSQEGLPAAKLGAYPRASSHNPPHQKKGEVSRNRGREPPPRAESESQAKFQAITQGPAGEQSVVQGVGTTG